MSLFKDSIGGQYWKSNKGLLIDNHIKAILEIEPIHRESACLIRETLDNLNKHLRALTALDQQTTHWDVLLIYILSIKLHKIIARAWEKEERKHKEPSTLEELRKFLNPRADMLQTLEINSLQADKKRTPYPIVF